VFAGTLRTSMFLGDQLICHFAVGEQLIAAKCRTVSARSGSRLNLRVDADDVMVFSAGKRVGRETAASAAPALAAVC
jgi:hypothetical protein